mgnify:CR=1 FL=1
MRGFLFIRWHVSENGNAVNKAISLEDKLSSKVIGQSEANMRAVFKQIKLMSPLCVWIDEFGRDLSGGSSSSHVDGGTTDRVHGEFLTGLQELPEETFLLCAANQLEALRPEMLRADCWKHRVGEKNL